MLGTFTLYVQLIGTFGKSILVPFTHVLRKEISTLFAIRYNLYTFNTIMDQDVLL